MSDAVEKKPKVKKEKKPKEKKDGVVARPRLPKFPEEHVITVLKPESKSRGAKDRFMRYQTGQPVKEYLRIMRDEFERTDGQTFADMRWDADHQFIAVAETVVPIPQPEAAPAA